VEKTNLVNIRYNHTNPELAQKVANTLADVFVLNNVERQNIVTSKAGLVLAKAIADNQEKVKKEREARFNFAKEHDLPLTPGTTNLDIIREGEYSHELLAAENEARNLKAAYEAAKSAEDPLANPEVQKDEH